MSVLADMAKLGERLQYATILWNSAECVVALVAGFVAGSIALVGFGFDSAIEVTSSVAAIWRSRWKPRRDRRACVRCFSAILLLGLGANAAFGWWWADPIAALGMVPFITWEGWQAVSGKTCCDD